MLISKKRSVGFPGPSPRFTALHGIDAETRLVYFTSYTTGVTDKGSGFFFKKNLFTRSHKKVSVFTSLTTGVIDKASGLYQLFKRRHIQG